MTGEIKLSKALQELLARTKTTEEIKASSGPPLNLDSDPEFIADLAKSWIMEDVHRYLRENKCTQSSLAKAYGSTRQHISEILNERANLTIESLARLSVAMDCELVLRIIPRDQRMWAFPADRSDEVRTLLDETEKPRPRMRRGARTESGAEAAAGPAPRRKKAAKKSGTRNSGAARNAKADR